MINAYYGRDDMLRGKMSFAYIYSENLHTNDNRRHVITGDIKTDTGALADKWGLTSLQMHTWAHSWAGFADKALCAITEAAKDLVTTAVPCTEAVMTAVVMGLIHQTFKLIQNLDHPEAMYALEEMSRQTDETIDKFREKR